MPQSADSSVDFTEADVQEVIDQILQGKSPKAKTKPVEPKVEPKLEEPKIKANSTAAVSKTDTQAQDVIDK